MALFLFFSLPTLVYAQGSGQNQDEYLTVEERNRRAQEEIKLLAKEQLPNFLNGPQENKEIDYSKYTNLIDFKNVFSGWKNTPPDSIYKDYGDEWQRNERERHQKYLSRKDITYVVMPVEDFAKRHDPTAKLLSAEYIAKALAQATGKDVLSPEVFLRASGEELPYFNDYEIHNLFQNSSPQFIHLYLKRVLPSLGPHPRENNEDRYDFAVILADADGKISKFKIYPLSKETISEPLEAKVRIMAQDIVQYILGSEIPENITLAAPAGQFHSISGSFANILSHLTSPLDHAAYLQLLAQLTPQECATEKKHLFERSLIAVEGIKENESAALLRARALYSLNRQLQAIQILEENPQSPEGIALKEYMNGNYTALKTAVTKIDDPLLYTFAFIEFHKLAKQYGKQLPEFDRSKTDSAWYELIDNILRQDDPWHLQDSQELAEAMYTIIPKTVVFRKELNLTGPEIDESFSFADSRYDEKMFIKLGAMALDMPEVVYGEHVTQTDILQLYRNIITSNLLRHLNRTVWLQGRYKAGIELAERQAYLFQGHPNFSYYYAQALYNTALKENKEMRGYYYGKTISSACLAEKNSFSYEDINTTARRLIRKVKNVYNPHDTTCNGYPAISYFPSSEQDTNIVSMNYSSMRSRYLSGKIAETDFRNILTKRFEGHPELIIDQAKDIRKTQGRQQQINYLEKISQQHSDQSWTFYETLGKTYLQEGDFQNATRAFFSHKSFYKIPDNDRVGLSNAAYQLGNYFYNIGRYKESVPFFTTSTSLHTGSGAEILASFNIACINKHYMQAAEIAYSGWKRYKSPPFFGRYSLMLSLLGSEEDNAKKIVALLNKASTNQNNDLFFLWQALRTDARIRQTPIPKALKTMQKIMPPPEKRRAYASFSSQNEVLKYCMIDRMLSKDVYTTLSEITHPSSLAVTSTPRWELFKKHYPQLTESAEDDHAQKNNRDFYPLNHQADLYLALLQIQEHDYNEALRLLLKYDRRIIASAIGRKNFQKSKGKEYPTVQSPMELQGHFILPYLFTSYVKSDYFHPKVFQHILEQWRISRKEIAFDQPVDYLVEAIALASLQQPKQALEVFRNSFLPLYNLNKSLLEPRWFQLFQMAEWLSAYTGNDGFIQCALQWSQRLQVTEPYLAWPYAFTALYEQDFDKRCNAAAFALYLDEKSYWLSKVPEEIMSLAQEQWQDIRPTWEKERDRQQEETNQPTITI